MHRQERKYIVREQTGKGEPKALAEQREILANKLNFASQEAYKLLRTNLMFSTCDEEKCKIIGLTSALRGEGKSTTAINLSYVLAEANKKTLLIEADMRLPRIQRLLQFQETVGLSNVLAHLEHPALRRNPPQPVGAPLLHENEAHLIHSGRGLRLHHH